MPLLPVLLGICQAGFQDPCKQVEPLARVDSNKPANKSTHFPGKQVDPFAGGFDSPNKRVDGFAVVDSRTPFDGVDSTTTADKSTHLLGWIGGLWQTS